MHYDTSEVKKGKKPNVRPQIIFFLFSFFGFCQKNTKHNDLKKKSQKPAFRRSEGPTGLLGSDAIETGFPNNHPRPQGGRVAEK